MKLFSYENAKEMTKSWETIRRQEIKSRVGLEAWNRGN